MALGRWKKVRQEFEISNPWWTYRKDLVRLPNGRPGEYHFVHVAGSSMIIPVRADGSILLVIQYRYLADRESLEFPCGSVRESSTYEQTARHELAEETGFAPGRLEEAGSFNPYNGVTDEFCRVYVARDLTPAAAQRDETEEFELLSAPPAEVDRLIRTGAIWDGMSLSAWALARHIFLPA